jgi:hypothetical protein
MRALLYALLSLAAFNANAAGLNKCADGAGRLTYTSETCEKEGLKSAGAIRDRVTILPTSAATRQDPPKKHEPAHPGPTVKPVTPLADQLTK